VEKSKHCSTCWKRDENNWQQTKSKEFRRNLSLQATTKAPMKSLQTKDGKVVQSLSHVPAQPKRFLESANQNPTD